MLLFGNYLGRMEESANTERERARAEKEQARAKKERARAEEAEAEVLRLRVLPENSASTS